MITITCGRNFYTYNAYHLAKAFFPGEDVRVCFDSQQTEAVILDIGGGRLRIPEAEDKAIVDRQIYTQFRQISGKDLPWGLLTGVRPTKPAMTKIREGMSRDEFIAWYNSEKLVSFEKAAIAYDIAETELDILNRVLPEESRHKSCSIYISIPFCTSICSYCSFSLGTVERYKDRTDAYINALCLEIKEAAALCRNKKITTVYIGGGTPTSLSAAQLGRVLDEVNKCFPADSLYEFTIEAGRPDSITAEKLKIMREHGVNRISINPQTMQQKTLDAVGRTHSVSDVRDAFDMARSAGFENINADLIAGLPGEDEADMEDTLNKILSLFPESLTVHALSIKRRAQMEHQYVQGEVVRRMTDMAGKAAASAGMRPYYLYRQKNIAGNFENIGYAGRGFEGIYNILTIEEIQSIIGIGAAAETKVVPEHAVPNPARGGKKGSILRCSNVKSVEGYIENVQEMISRKRELISCSR